MVPFWSFRPEIGEGKFYDDAASQALICMCELFENMVLLYSMKLIVDLCKSPVDAELLYNSSMLAHCDNCHLFKPDRNKMELIYILYPHVIFFMLLVGFYMF